MNISGNVLGDIKEHLEKEHDKSGSINHYYRCGRNQEFFKEIYYSWRDLFVNRRNWEWTLDSLWWKKEGKNKEFFVSDY